jgi:hypothetical protein
VLGTLGLEHKALAGPFARAFPRATVWVQPGQWSFPLPIPLPLLGFPWGARLRTLPPADSPDAPEWVDELDYELLGPLRFKAVGAFSETAFFHKETSTLLVTDTIVQVDETPPPIIAEDPRALLYHARRDITEEVVDTPATRMRGWRRVALFGLIFRPSDIDVRLVQLVSDLGKLPASMRALSQGNVPLGLYPWEWARDDEASFRALSGGVFVAPILQALILNRFPDETLAWARRVARWRFTRIIPSHLANDIRTSPSAFLAAFDFCKPAAATAPGVSGPAADSPLASLDALLAGSPLRRRAPAPLARDLGLLDAASELCTTLGLVEEPSVAPAVTPERK